MGRISVSLEEMDASFPSTVVVEGSGYFVRIPKSVIDFWDLMIDDELLVKLRWVKRAREHREGEKP